MATMKSCPSCKKEIDEKLVKCPHCQKQLEIQYWEIEQDNGEKILLTSENAESTIRNNLLTTKLRLTNRARQYTDMLKSIEDGKDQYVTKQDKGWKTLRDYADQVYSLQALYNPIMADGKKMAQNVFTIVGVITAIGWNTIPLVNAGANIVLAILISGVLLILTPTVVGMAIGSFVVGNMYGFPPFGMAVRTVVAIIVGLIVGGIVGWTLGFGIGALIGLTKKKVLSLNSA